MGRFFLPPEYLPDLSGISPKVNLDLVPLILFAVILKINLESIEKSLEAKNKNMLTF